MPTITNNSRTWIIGTAAAVASFTLGYYTRARDLLRPSPGHIYRIGPMIFADDALLHRVASIVPRGGGVVWIKPPGCYTTSLRP
jgi:hypothetical protein